MVKKLAAGGDSSAGAGLVAVAKAANLVLAFALELAVLAAVGYWGHRTGNTTATNWLLAVAVVAGFITLWALFGAPKARFALRPIGKRTFQIAWHAAGAALLAASGQVRLAVLMLIAVLVHTLLAIVWNQ